MAEPTDLIPGITTAAGNPRSATQDGSSASTHSLLDQIAADRYLKSSAALAARPLGFRRVRLAPGNNADVEFR